jgi:hypothetical protein
LNLHLFSPSMILIYICSVSFFDDQKQENFHFFGVF